MIFNSITFLIFFIIVFLIYWILLKNNTKLQNIFLLLVSYFFYGYANWKMLPLLAISTFIFYEIGIFIRNAKSEKISKAWTYLGVIIGITILLYFKYLNFFIESFIQLFNTIGFQINIHTFNIIMPLGISFFTFRLISYVIDIYHDKIEPNRDFVTFATYISFFPCLLSGPIDRPKFIQQLEKDRTFDYNKAVDGCRQILWGLFKKVVVADNCAVYVDQIWNNYHDYTGSTLLLSAIIYVFQMYADFSGYSDMAIGVGKLLGFKIADNFKTPLFALNIKDFWQRWHISLTNWLTDYVFMPLNLSFRNLGTLGIVLAIIVNFVLCGLWHGANWTFVVWGLYHGLLYVPLILTGEFYKKAKLKTYNKIDIPIFKDFCRMALTFMLVAFGLIIFRANTLADACAYIGEVLSADLISVPWLINRNYYIPQVIFISIMLVIEWKLRKQSHQFDIYAVIKNKWINRIIYFILIVLIFWVGGKAETYIYFQF